MNPPSLGSTLNVAAAVAQQSAAMTTANHHAVEYETAPIRRRGRVMDLLRTQTEIQTGIADQMGLMWTVVVGECVSVGGVCVSRAGLGQYMANTVR